MKILFVTNIPAPYKVIFLSELAKKVNLTVIYERESASDRDESWKNRQNKKNFEEIYLRGKNIGNEASFSIEIIHFLKKKKYDYVIMNGFSSPTAIIAITYMKFFKIKYVIMCDGMLPGATNRLKVELKKFLISNASFCFGSNKITKNELEKYGAKEKNIFWYPFSSISDATFLEEKTNLLIKDKTTEKIVLYVGQFIHRKGLDILIEAFEKIIESNDERVKLLLIGGEVLPFQVPNSVKNMIEIKGFKKKEELSEYYRMADVFVLPTREDIWGLVINEAMGFGVPVVTTDRCGAGLEMVENKKNGFVVVTGDSESLAKSIKEVLNNSEEMKLAALETGKKYTIEKMSQRIYDVLNSHQIEG